MLDTIEAISLKTLPGIRHGFFTRAGGTSTGLYASLNCGLGSNDDQQAVLENRARVARHLGASHPLPVTLYQVHGATALTISTPVSSDALPKADAIVTSTPGLAIGILTADCAPLLFADPVAKIVAAAHAGWRGAFAGVAEAAILEMERQGADRSRIHAVIGPCINQDAYEVGQEFESELTAADEKNVRFFSKPTPESRSHFDLPAYVEARLKTQNLGYIERQTACTHQNESNFFSFRRSTQRKEPDYGRQISAILVA